MASSNSNNGAGERDEKFGYGEALAEVTAQLAASVQRRVEAERAARRALWRRGPALLDARGLALSTETADNQRTNRRATETRC